MPLIKLNNRSIKDVTSFPFGVGNLILISSQTASNSASISFTTGINSTYKEYQFYFIDMRANNSSVANFECNFSTDGGSNYNVTKTTTNFGAYHTQSGSVSDLAYAGVQDLAQSTGYQPLVAWQYMGNGSVDALTGTMSLFNPSSTTYVKHFIATIQHNQSNISDNAFIAGYCNTTSAVNAVRFRASVGNIDGTIAMFGVL